MLVGIDFNSPSLATAIWLAAAEEVSTARGSGWVSDAHLWTYGPTRYREVVLTWLSSCLPAMIDSPCSSNENRGNRHGLKD